jgi:hypothetical protein
LEEQRDTLARVVACVDSIQFSAALEADGAIVFAQACELGLKGIGVEARRQSL